MDQFRKWNIQAQAEWAKSDILILFFQLANIRKHKKKSQTTYKTNFFFLEIDFFFRDLKKECLRDVSLEI